MNKEQIDYISDVVTCKLVIDITAKILQAIDSGQVPGMIMMMAGNIKEFCIQAHHNAVVRLETLLANTEQFFPVDNANG